MTLGRLIAVLKGAKQDATVRFDFGYMVPGRLHSWRGSYSELAFDYKEGEWPNYPKVAEVLLQCESAIGNTFTGWKGGDYVMDKDTPLHIAHPGDSGNTLLTGAFEYYDDIILETRWHD